MADNVAMRGALDWLERVEALDEAGMRTHLTRARRIIIFAVNSLSAPPTHWDRSENPPAAVDLLLKATGVPIDHYSHDSVELLQDTAARWQDRREIRESVTIKPNANPAVADLLRVPNATIYAIDVSFAALKDKAERDGLNAQPTSNYLRRRLTDCVRRRGRSSNRRRNFSDCSRMSAPIWSRNERRLRVRRWRRSQAGDNGLRLGRFPTQPCRRPPSDRPNGARTARAQIRRPPDAAVRRASR